MLPGAPAADGKGKRRREENPLSRRIGDLSVNEPGPKRERVETEPTPQIDTELTLEISAGGPTPQQYSALTSFARDAAHTALAHHANGQPVPPLTITAPHAVANQVQQTLNRVITSHLPFIQRDLAGDQRLSADRIPITMASPSGTTTTISLPPGTDMTPAPQPPPQPLPQYNYDLATPPSPSPPSSPSNPPSTAQSTSQPTPTHATNPPLPQRHIDDAKRRYTDSRAELFAPLWGTLLNTPEPMDTNRLKNSGQLPLKFPVSRTSYYLSAMKEAGLLVESGQAGLAPLYTPVMPTDVSKTESDALLDWARGLPVPTASTTATTYLNTRPNILNLPNSLHKQLVRNTAKNQDSPLLVSRTLEILLTAEKPLTQQDIVNHLKEQHQFSSTSKGTVATYLNAMIATSIVNSSTAGLKTSKTAEYTVKVPLPSALLNDSAFKIFIKNLPDDDERARARQRSEGIDPISLQATTAVPPTFPVSETLKNALHPDGVSKVGQNKEKALSVWGTLLANNPATNKELESALPGTIVGKNIRYYTQWLQQSNMAVVDRRIGTTNVYKGTVPQGLESDPDLRSWVNSLPAPLKANAQSCLDNPSVASATQSWPQLPTHVTKRIEKDDLNVPRSSQVLGILLRTDTPLTSEMITTRLKTEHNVDITKEGVKKYLQHLNSVELASLYSRDGTTRFLVGSVPKSLRNDPGLAKWAAELADEGERANAQARVSGTEPLGAARPLPPLPAVLRDAYGDRSGKLYAAATLGALLSTDKPLSVQDLADVVQRDYHLGHGKRAAREDLAKLRTLGLLKEMNKTGGAYYFTAVVPADTDEVTKQEQKALSAWAREALTGQAQKDALTRISGVEPLESNPSRRNEIVPIKRSNFTSATQTERLLPPMQDGKQLFHRRHIIPSHQMRDTFSEWVNYHYPPGHHGRAEMVQELQAWEKSMVNYVPNLWVGRGNTNTAAGFLSKALSNAANHIDLVDRHVTGREAVKAIEYNKSAAFRTQKDLAKPVLEFLDPPKDPKAKAPAVKVPGQPDWTEPEWSAAEFLSEASSSADFDWPGGTREQYNQFMDVYLKLGDIALAPDTYSLSDLQAVRDRFLSLPEPSAVTAGNGLIDYDIVQDMDIDPVDIDPVADDTMDVDDVNLPPPPVSYRLEEDVERTAQRLNELRLKKPYTFVTGEYDAEVAELEIRFGKLLAGDDSLLRKQIDTELDSQPNPARDVQGYALSQQKLLELNASRKAANTASVVETQQATREAAWEALRGYEETRNALEAERARLLERRETITSSSRPTGLRSRFDAGLRQGRRVMEGLNASQITQLAYYASIRELNQRARTADQTTQTEIEARVSGLHTQIEHLSTLDTLPADALNLLDELDHTQMNQLFHDYELPVIDQALRDITEKLDLVTADETQMRRQMTSQQPTSQQSAGQQSPGRQSPGRQSPGRTGAPIPVEYTRTNHDGRLDQLVSQLPTMSPMERAAALERLHGDRQKLLAGNPDLIRRLRDTLPPEVFAQTAAQLMVRSSSHLDQPVTARHEAEAQIARMLGNPEIAERLLNKGVQVVLIPEDTALTDLEEFQHLTDQHISPGHGTWNTARGAGGTIHVAVGAENLTGGTTTASHTPHYDDGYSVLIHEFAHTIHKHGLTDEDRHTITQAFHNKWNQVHNGEHVQWPDGPTYGTNTGQPNYSATTPEEYFAQLTNAYHGTNTGHDPYTHHARNNGKNYVNTHEPDEIIDIIHRVHGTNPPRTTANPTRQTTTDNDLFKGYRQFLTHNAGRTPTSTTDNTPTNSPKLTPTNNPTLTPTPSTGHTISNAAQLRAPGQTHQTNNHPKTTITHTDTTMPPKFTTTTATARPASL